MQRLLRLCYFETLRILLRKRWLLIIPIVAVLAYASADFLNVGHFNYHIAFNVWDGMFFGLGNGKMFFFILAPLFVFFAGDIFIRDYHSDYLLFTTSRTSSKVLLWGAKVCAIFLVAFVYTVVIVLIFSLVNLFTFHYSSAFGEFVTSTNHFMQMLRAGYNTPHTSSPFLFFVYYTLYTTVGMFIYALIPVTVSLFLTNFFSPLLIAYAVSLSSFYFPFQFAKWDLGANIYYFIHLLGIPFFSTPISILCLLITGTLLFVIGALYIKRKDF